MMYRKAKAHLFYQVWLVCAIGLFVDGYDLYVSAMAEPFLRHDFNFSPMQMGLLQSSPTLGAVFGALVFGRAADIFGRKLMLLCNFIFFILTALLSALAWNIESLILFRFLIGVGVGADYPICAAYISELCAKKNTAKIMAILMCINCLASPASALIAGAIVHVDTGLNAWRWMFASGALIASVGLFFRFSLPESFVWKAHQRLKKKQQDTQSFFSAYEELFSPKMIRITLCLGLSWFCLDVAYYGLGLFTPHILAAFQGPSTLSLHDEITHLINQTLFVNTFVFIGAVGGVFLLAKLTLKRLQVRGFLVLFIGLGLMSCSTLFVEGAQLNVLFLGFILFNFAANAGPGCTTYILPTVFYAPRIRGMGHGVASSAGKLGAFLGALMLPLLQYYWGINVTLVFIAGITLVGLLMSLWIPSSGYGVVDVVTTVSSSTYTSCHPEQSEGPPDATVY